MARNRFRKRRTPHLRQFRNLLGDLLFDGWRVFRSGFKMILLTVILVLAGVGLFEAAKSSPYFRISAVRVEHSERVSREDVLHALRLSDQNNYFLFDHIAAEERLQEHDWVAEVEIKKMLPNKVVVHIQERKAVAVVALDELHLVDAEGRVFTKAKNLKRLPSLTVTGLTSEQLQRAPDEFMSRVRRALTIERLYRTSPIAQIEPLDTINLHRSGRWELMIGRTHVVLGADRIEQRLDYLKHIFDTLESRKLDAEYIMIAPDLNRAIVREIPERSEGKELTLKTENYGGEAR